MTLDWHAAFITPQLNFAGETRSAASYFRRDFTAPHNLTKAVLRITAIGVVEPWLNGERVGDEVLAPGWTSYKHRLVVSTYDVTDHVRVGANTLGAVVADGWALGRLGWEDKRNHFAERRALSAQLELHTTTSVEYVATDGEWHAGTGGTRAASIYDGETFDARLEPAGWAEPTFDGAAWQRVENFDWPTAALIEPESEPIRRIEELAPVAVLTTPSGRTVVDFGQEISGWVRFTASVASGATVTIRHAEWLIDGEIDVETLRSARATDTYIGDGNGPATWEPRFTFHGFRYAEITGWPGAITADAVRAIVVHTDMRRTGWLTTSSPLLNRLHDNVVWSMRGNFVGVPTDCPQRDERLGWTGDINAFAPTAAFLHDVRGVLGSWLADLAAEHTAKGFVPWVVPDVLSTPSAPTALWSDVAVSLPWTLYREYGDAAILERSYPSAARFVRDVAGRLNDHGVWASGYQFGDWLDPDAPDDNPAGGKTDRYLVATAYFAKVAREMSSTAAELGRSDDEREFRALAARVKEAFQHEFVTPAGRLTNETATAYALAIVFDLLTAEQRAHAGGRLADVVARSGYTISTGFAGTPLVTDALSSTGHVQEAYLLLMQEQCPSFLYPVTMGATTIWERWDSVRPDGTINPSGMTSLNHYALGAVADWMHRTIGGLTATEPGYRRMRIEPQPGGGLTHATLRHHTVHGQVEVSWNVEGGHGKVSVSVPPGARAEVVLPLHADGLVEEVEAGTHTWSYELDATRTAPRDYSMDTSLADLGKDPSVWAPLAAVFATYLPGIPIDPTSPEASGMSLNTMLAYIPGDLPELRAALVAAVTATSTTTTQENSP